MCSARRAPAGAVLAGAALLVAATVVAGTAVAVAARPAAAGPADSGAPGGGGREPVLLQVIAAGDEPGEQRLKLVAGEAALGALFGPGGEGIGAHLAGAAARERVAAAVAAALAASGAPRPVRVEWGVISFLARRWAGRELPAGGYPTLRIVIGAGAGRNLWCVLFPPLCIDSAGRVALAAPAAGAEAGRGALWQQAPHGPARNARSLAPQPFARGRPLPVAR